MGQKVRILLLEGIHNCAKDALEAQGFFVQRESRAFPEEELVSLAENFDAIGIRSKTQLTESVVTRLPHLQVIGAFCIGTNQINLEATHKKGIPVFNAPYSNTRSVAELVIAELISLSRKLGDISKWAHQGRWNKSATGSFEVRGKVLGIVGYGHIGSQVSVLAESMGLKVKYFDIVKKLPLGNAQAVDSMEDLLRQSDFVTFHVPETSLTQNMMGEKEIAQMKPSSYLINASRGSVVDISALAKALKDKHLAGAAIDVFPEEPASNKEAFQSELQGLENVILTPHIGGSTEEAQQAIGLEVAESLIQFFQRGSTYSAVAFPSLDVPPLTIPNVARLTNIHHNVPGVLSQINSIVSKHGGNIRAQYLSTDDVLGYVVMDLEKTQANAVSAEISQLKTSLQTRCL